MYIDENLSWSEHIAYICKKISKSVGIIYRSRFCLLTNTKLMLYYALIYPYLTYCNIVWASTYPSNLTRLLLMQKRAVRAITNAYYRAHTKPLFLQLGVLNIYQINTFYTCFYTIAILYLRHLTRCLLQEIKYTYMIQDMHWIIVLTLAEPVLKNLLYYFGDQNCGIHYQKILLVKRLLVVSGTE